MWIDGEYVRNRSGQFGDWDLRIADLRLVGEATTDQGPFVDDWMLVLAVDWKCWYEASMYVPNVADGVTAWEALGRAMGANLLPGLAGSADYASRVLWPESLEGRAVFTYEDDPARNWLDRAWRALGGGAGSNTQTWTDEMSAFLRSSGGRPT
jgi:hypothetical protein